MKSTNIKNNILKLIDLKNETSDVIQQIYNESNELRICIYDSNEIFVQSPRGFEELAKIFKKRIVTSPNKNKGKYSIKKYFVYKEIEFFCLYKISKNRNSRIQKIADTIGKALSVFKTVGLFVWGILKAVAK